MDGTSVTMYLIDGAFEVCSRNYEIGDDETSPAWKFVNKHNVQEKIQKGAAAIGLKNVAVQGEFCGEGIQKNPLKLVICNIENALKKIVNTWNNLLAFTFLKSLFHKLFYGTRSQTPPCFRSLFA